MAALRIAHHFRVDIDAAIKAVENYEPRMNRSQIIKTGYNTLIMDAYNANPSSMKAALTNFAAMNGANKIVLLGDMFELGTEAAYEHKAILELALSLNFSSVITAGPDFALAHPANPVFRHSKSQQNFRIATNRPSEGATILVKGSRGMKLETVTGNL